jgi:hypothetical protein
METKRLIKMAFAHILAAIMAIGFVKPTVPDGPEVNVPSPKFLAQGFVRACAEEMSCSLNVIQEAYAASRYRVEVRVEDIQTKETVCHLEADLEAVATDVLQADGGAVSMMLERTGDVVINGLVEDECSGADVNGRYRPQNL